MCRVRSEHTSDPLLSRCSSAAWMPSLVRWLLVLLFLGLSLCVLPTPLALALTLAISLLPSTVNLVWHTGRRDAQLAYRCTTQL